MASLKNLRPRLSSREAWALFCACLKSAGALIFRSASLVGLILCGCQQTTPTELPLAEQIAQVRSGISESIVVESVPLSDDDLQAINDLNHLEVLLLDHPDNRFSSSGLKNLSGLTSLKHLRLRGRGVDDQAAEQIANVKSLRILNVPQATISAAGLTHLANLPNLEQLRLGSPNISLPGIEAIAMLPALKRLHLIDVPVGEAGLKALGTMKRLESLYLDGADISDAAVEELFRARPELHVHFNQQHHDRDPSRHSHTP